MPNRELDRLLHDVSVFVRRFVVMSEAQLVAITLWIAHTHAIDAAEATPYLTPNSPTKRSGKTRLLEVLALLVRNPLRAAGASEAALFRSIASESPPTLLMDEVDAIFGPKAREHEDIRALLNAGYTRGNPVLRCVGEGSKQRVLEFSSFCPKALAGIGALPDTVSDRALPIRLKRRTRSETVERFRVRQVKGEAVLLYERLAAWADENLDALAEARPALPEELDDRAQDTYEPLFAIADMAGGEWPDIARRALVLLRSEQADEEDDAIGVRLLADVWTAFEREPADRISTERLLVLLSEDSEAPWSEWHGRPLTARGLAQQLKPFGVRSRNVRLPDGTTPKGYKREQFEDLWRRYPPENGSQNATSATTPSLSQKQAVFNPPQRTSVAFPKSASKPHEQRVVADVADRPLEKAENADRAATCVVCDRTFALGENGSAVVTCASCVSRREAMA